MESLTSIYSENLAEKVWGCTKNVSFGNNYHLVPVVSPDIVEQVELAGVGMDSLAKIEAKPGFASVSEGLGFDLERVRTQSLAIYEKAGDSPVGIMTVVIVPRVWIRNRRYFQEEDGGARVVDVQAVTGGVSPFFYVIPAWTHVLPSHRLTFARPGFRVLCRIIKLLEEESMPNTWIEIVAQGQFPWKDREKLIDLSTMEVGTFIPENSLPFELDMIGKNSPGSSSSVKMAKLMGLKQVPNLGSGSTLGPVFIRRAG